MYTSCLCVHHDESISEYDKGQFAVQAWLESERIVKILDTHTCDIEMTTRRFSHFCLLSLMPMDSLLRSVFWATSFIPVRMLELFNFAVDH
jgi:hypothetical protein